MKANGQNIIARNRFQAQCLELEAQGFSFDRTVMSGPAGSPQNGAWFSNGDQRARIVNGEISYGDVAKFNQQYDAYVQSRNAVIGAA